MNTVRVYRLKPPPKLFACLKAAQMEAANVWNPCVEIHKQARMSHTRWPGRNELQKATKGQFALHSQSVQAVFRAFLANIEITRQVRKTHPQLHMKYPSRFRNDFTLFTGLLRLSPKSKGGSYCRWAEGELPWCCPLSFLNIAGLLRWSGTAALSCTCVLDSVQRQKPLQGNG